MDSMSSRQPYVWLDATKAAAYLNIGQNRIRGLMESGELRNVLIGTRRRTTYEWCDEYVNQLVAKTNEQYRSIPTATIRPGANQAVQQAYSILNKIEANKGVR